MYLLVAPGYGPPGGSTIEMYTLANAANYPFQILTGPTAVTVPTYTFPPNADQMGTALQLDTLDGRFVNRSTQIGSSVFNAHTVDFSATGGSGFAAPEIYQVDASTGTLTWSNKWFQAGDSDDFNVSVAVEATGGPAPIGSGTPEDIYVTWTSTSPSSYNAEMVVSGERPPYAAIETLGQVCATSPTYYTGFRWGDYSSVDLTATGQAAEAVNEYIEGNTVWGSKICRFKY